MRVSLAVDNGSTSSRLPAVDGLRGLLALLVLVYHLTYALGFPGLAQAANLAVCGFFTLSGYVLTRAWDGRWGVFLARRFLRLWPVYALCLGAGYALAGVHPVWTQFVWYPILTANATPRIDPPIWSLCVEAWAMPFMPLVVWIGRGPMTRIALGLAITALAATLYIKLAFGLFFILGAAASRWDFRDSVLESPVPQWIGRVSYSLYLTHWLVFEAASRTFGAFGLLASVPFAFALGWAVWRFVERPSIGLSRRVGRASAAARASRAVRDRPAGIAA